MSPLHNFFRLAVQCGLFGFVSGALSCVMADSRILYVARAQKTFDHIVWPGIVFALVVILPISRLARDRWPRTIMALITSCFIYPISWHIAASTIRHPGASMVVGFAFSGLLGSLMLASVLLYGRPRWVRAIGVTMVVGTAIGGLMGAHLLASVKGYVTLGSTGDILAIYMVLWQASVGTSLGRGVLAKPKEVAPMNGSAGSAGAG